MHFRWCSSFEIDLKDPRTKCPNCTYYFDQGSIVHMRSVQNEVLSLTITLWIDDCKILSPFCFEIQIKDIYNLKTCLNVMTLRVIKNVKKHKL